MASRLTQWHHFSEADLLPDSTSGVVTIIDSEQELARLCNRSPAGVENKESVGFNDQLKDLCGKAFKVVAQDERDGTYRLAR